MARDIWARRRWWEQSPAAAGAAALHVAFWIVALVSTPLFAPNIHRLPPSIAVTLTPPTEAPPPPLPKLPPPKLRQAEPAKPKPIPEPQPQTQPRPAPSPVLKPETPKPEPVKPAPKEPPPAIAPAPSPIAPQVVPQVVAPRKVQLDKLPQAQAVTRPKPVLAPLATPQIQVEQVPTVTPEDAEAARRAAAQKEAQRRQEDERRRLEILKAQEAARTTPATAPPAAAASAPAGPPAAVHASAAPAAPSGRPATGPSFIVAPGGLEDGAAGGLRGVLRSTVGCEHQDYARLTPQERARCQAAFARDARGGGAIDGIPTDKRVDFDRAAVEAARKRAARQGSLPPVIVPCEGAGSNLGAGCLPDDAHIRLKPPQ